MTEIAQHIKQVFEDIHQHRMVDMPMVNPALSVEVLGFDEKTDGRVGILITPWCMNLMLVPLTEDWSDLKPGTKQCHSLPSGQYEFVVAQEQGLGAYQSCSLFSPMFEFGDQATAVATGQAALSAVMAGGPTESQADVSATSESSGMSRRAFLRGDRWR